jgi:hypothetical protein
MTPKEKAEVLISKYKKAPFNCTDCDMPYCDVPCTRLSLQESKECALIAVDECIKAVESDWSFMEIRMEYWQKVKQEIEKI